MVPVSEALRFVLVRGLARAAGHWHEFDAGLRERFPSASFERCDLAGNGDQWRRRSPPAIDELAADLRARVLATDPRPPLLITISLGAMVGLTWLTRWPNELRALVTINTSAGRLSHPLRRLQPRGLVATLAAALERDALERELRVLALTTRDFGRDRELARAHAQLYEHQPTTAANLLRQMIAAARFRVEAEALPREHPPILMLSSRGDRMVDPSCTDALARAFAATQRVHPDAGHDLTLDAPRWCTDQIGQWLAQRLAPSDSGSNA